MNLKQIRSRNFDDILYMGIKGHLQKKQALPAELFKTDEEFLRVTYELYAELEKEHITVLRQVKKSGVSTALMFIIAYYSLHHDTITIVQKPGAHSALLQPVFRMFADFADFKCSIDKKSNQVFLRHENDVFCTINLLNDTAFNAADISGLVVFDNCTKLKNPEKYTDLFNNKEKYDKVILNFPESDLLNKLAVDYNLKIKEIRILNE